MSDARDRAQAGLDALVDAALAALGTSLKGGRRERGSTAASDARYVLDVVLGRQSAAEPTAAAAAEGKKPAEKLDPREAWAEIQRRRKAARGSAG